MFVVESIVDKWVCSPMGKIALVTQIINGIQNAPTQFFNPLEIRG